MWNSRVTLTVLASLVVLVLLCSVSGAAYMPNYSSRRISRLTDSAHTQAAAIVAATEAIGATRAAHLPTETAVAGATETEAARPTTTPTPTSTPTSTATPSATPPATVVECPAIVAGTDRLLYPVPGGGQVLAATLLPRDGSVSMIGRLKDQGWVQVRTASGETGWMRSDVITPISPDCQVNVYDLAYLLGMAGARNVAADDTFVSNENGWVNGAGDALSPVLGADGDAQLVVTTNGVEQLRPTSANLKNVPVFELATSFSRVNFYSDSYIGVRFRDNGLTYYELRIQRDCQIAVYAINQVVFTRPVDPGPNTCTDALDDWLQVSLSTDYRLTVQLNDAELVEVALEDPAGLYTGGGVELIVGRARATFSYVVVTVPLK